MDTNESGSLRRRQELGRFLRTRREHVTPDKLGIAVRRRRRAQGLLREEVAEHAGVSVTWYTWLEQARPMNPSARVLDGLAKALQLDASERRHLYRLARPDLRVANLPAASECLSPGLDALLQGLLPHPAYAINACWDVIAWNESANRVFGGFAHLRADERNILSRLLLDAAWRELFVDCDRILESAVAQFRATTAQVAASARVTEFVARLCERSPAFETLWARQHVAQPPVCQKTLKHPRVGKLKFDYATFRPDGASPDVRFTIYTPADVASAQRVRRLIL